MYSCKLCHRGLLERSLPFGYKIELPRFRSNASNNNHDVEEENRCCRYLEIGLTKRPLFDVDRTEDHIIIKLSDFFAHCTTRRGNEIILEMDEWRTIMDHREYIERYFANVPVIQRYMLSKTLTMYFDTYDVSSSSSSSSCSSSDKKYVFLTKEIEEEHAHIVRIPEQTMMLLFGLSDFVEEMYKQYLIKVPYTCYVFEKFLYILRTSTIVDSLYATMNPEERRQMTRKYLQKHWFFEETSLVHNELLNTTVDDIIASILDEVETTERS